jgi:hypothetical protein
MLGSAPFSVSMGKNVLDVTLTGFLVGGFTVLSTKGISTLLTLEWIDMFTEWITYPVILVSESNYKWSGGILWILSNRYSS